MASATMGNFSSRRSLGSQVHSASCRPRAFEAWTLIRVMARDVDDVAGVFRGFMDFLFSRHVDINGKMW